MLTGLCSHEELNRWLYYAHSLKRRHGVPFESALTSDVPTQTWSLPSTLAAAGIRYYATGINTTRGYTFNKLMSGHPYWWEGPDGSRVLAYFAPGYAHAAGPLSNMNELKNWVIANTRNRADFPYDALFLYGGFGDNQAIQENVAATAQEWANTYEYPKVIVSTNAAYFRYMEATYGRDLPVVRGDGGHYWEDGAASSAQETALNRRAHETASAADALFALAHCAGGKRPPATALDELWKNILLYDEHTWGAYSSISEPDSAFSKEQWRIKASFAQEADRQSGELLEGGLDELAARIKTEGPALLLFNGTSWDRENELIEVDLPTDVWPGDPKTGEPLPAAGTVLREESRRVHFVAPTIPAWGYVACPLVQGKPGQAKSRHYEMGAAIVLENRHYRVAVDSQRGCITSLIDKATGRELVDQGAGYGLGEYLYVSGGDGTNIVDIGANKPAELTIHEPHEPNAADVPDELRFEGVCETLSVVGQAEKTPLVWTRITLYDAVPRVDLRVQLRRFGERKKEAAYIAFPFAAADPEVRLEIPNGVMRPEVDQLPGGCKEWYALQHFARVRSDAGEIAWASVDAPLVCVGDINRGLWPEKLEVKNGRLYSYIMNNYWFTNYKADQEGGGGIDDTLHTGQNAEAKDGFVFRYSITSRASSDAEAARFGWQAAMPIRMKLITGAQEGPLPATPTSLCRVSPESVAVTAIKTPEVGSGLVVRLFSYDEKPVTARVKLGVAGLREAELCNLVEEPVEKLQLSDGEFKVRVTPMAPVTVVVR